MIKRIWLYLQEMYPPLSRLFVGLSVFFIMYFIVLLNSHVTAITIGPAEFTGAFTIFGFLLFLRVADDFKDYETDRIHFSTRTLPSGKVHKRDLVMLLIVVETAIVILNFIFMNNLLFFLLLYAYGGFMSVWFFQKNVIQKSLPLALITHNPVQIVVNLYAVSFTCIKYGIDWFTPPVILAVLTLYLPGLIWEVSRKIRAPLDETAYTTYSKLFGYQRATRFVALLTLLDLVPCVVLVFNLSTVALILLVVNTTWMMVVFARFIKDPTRFTLVKHVLRYTFIQAAILILAVVLYLTLGRF